MSTEGRETVGKMVGAWWWIDRWRNSTAFTDMTAEEQGLYRNLCDEVWLRPDHVIPDDPHVLARVSGDHRAWKRSGAKVLRWMTKVDGGWTNETAVEVLKESRRRAEKQQRYRDRRRNASGNADGNASGNGGGNPAGNNPGNNLGSLDLDLDPRRTEPPVVPHGGTAAAVDDPADPADSATKPVNGHRVNGHRPGSAIERERQALESKPEIAAIADYWRERFDRPSREIGVLRAAAKALAGGYAADTLRTVIRVGAVAKREPHRFAERGSYRWAAGAGKLTPDYLLRPGEPLDRFAAEAEAWERD